MTQFRLLLIAFALVMPALAHAATDACDVNDLGDIAARRKQAEERKQLERRGIADMPLSESAISRAGRKLDDEEAKATHALAEPMRRSLPEDLDSELVRLRRLTTSTDKSVSHVSTAAMHSRDGVSVAHGHEGAFRSVDIEWTKPAAIPLPLAGETRLAPDPKYIGAYDRKIIGPFTGPRFAVDSATPGESFRVRLVTEGAAYEAVLRSPRTTSLVGLRAIDFTRVGKPEMRLESWPEALSELSLRPQGKGPARLRLLGDVDITFNPTAADLADPGHSLVRSLFAQATKSNPGKFTAAEVESFRRAYQNLGKPENVAYAIAVAERGPEAVAEELKKFRVGTAPLKEEGAFDFRKFAEQLARDDHGNAGLTIRSENGVFAKLHGENPHALQLIAILHGLDPARREEFLRTLEKVIDPAGKDSWIVWSGLFDGFSGEGPHSPVWWHTSAAATSSRAVYSDGTPAGPKAKLGFFLADFDPPTQAQLAALEKTRVQLGLDEIHVFVDRNVGSLPFASRQKMTEIAFAESPHVKVIEASLLPSASPEQALDAFVAKNGNRSITSLNLPDEVVAPGFHPLNHDNLRYALVGSKQDTEMVEGVLKAKLGNRLERDPALLQRVEIEGIATPTKLRDALKSGAVPDDVPPAVARYITESRAYAANPLDRISDRFLTAALSDPAEPAKMNEALARSKAELPLVTAHAGESFSDTLKRTFESKYPGKKIEVTPPAKAGATASEVAVVSIDGREALVAKAFPAFSSDFGREIAGDRALGAVRARSFGVTELEDAFQLDRGGKRAPVLVMKRAPGESSSAVFDRLFEAGDPASLKKAEATSAEVGRALGDLQRQFLHAEPNVSASAYQVLRAKEELKQVLSNQLFERKGWLTKAESKALAEKGDALIERFGREPPRATTVALGDLHTGNVFVGEEKPTFIDIGSATHGLTSDAAGKLVARGDPAADVGRFLESIGTELARKSGDPSVLAPVEESFRKSYEAASGLTFAAQKDLIDYHRFRYDLKNLVAKSPLTDAERERVLDHTLTRLGIRKTGSKAAVSAFAGSFDPPTSATLGVMRKAIEHAPNEKLIVMVDSAGDSLTSLAERQRMIRAGLGKDADRVVIIPTPREGSQAAIRRLKGQHEKVYQFTGDEGAASRLPGGNAKTIVVDRAEGISGTAARAAIESGNAAEIGRQLDPQVAKIVNEEKLYRAPEGAELLSKRASYVKAWKEFAAANPEVRERGLAMPAFKPQRSAYSWEESFQREIEKSGGPKPAAVAEATPAVFNTTITFSGTTNPFQYSRPLLESDGTAAKSAEMWKTFSTEFSRESGRVMTINKAEYERLREAGNPARKALERLGFEFTDEGVKVPPMPELVSRYNKVLDDYVKAGVIREEDTIRFARAFTDTEGKAAVVPYGELIPKGYKERPEGFLTGSTVMKMISGGLFTVGENVGWRNTKIRDEMTVALHDFMHFVILSEDPKYMAAVRDFARSLTAQGITGYKGGPQFLRWEHFFEIGDAVPKASREKILSAFFPKTEPRKWSEVAKQLRSEIRTRADLEREAKKTLKTFESEVFAFGGITGDHISWPRRFSQGEGKRPHTSLRWLSLQLQKNLDDPLKADETIDYIAKLRMGMLKSTEVSPADWARESAHARLDPKSALYYYLCVSGIFAAENPYYLNAYCEGAPSVAAKAERSLEPIVARGAQLYPSKSMVTLESAKPAVASALRFRDAASDELALARKKYFAGELSLAELDRVNARYGKWDLPVTGSTEADRRLGYLAQDENYLARRVSQARLDQDEALVSDLEAAQSAASLRQLTETTRRARDLAASEATRQAARKNVVGTIADDSYFAAYQSRFPGSSPAQILSDPGQLKHFQAVQEHDAVSAALAALDSRASLEDTAGFRLVSDQTPDQLGRAKKLVEDLSAGGTDDANLRARGWSKEELDNCHSLGLCGPGKSVPSRGETLSVATLETLYEDKLAHSGAATAREAEAIAGDAKGATLAELQARKKELDAEMPAEKDRAKTEQARQLVNTKIEKFAKEPTVKSPGEAEAKKVAEQTKALLGETREPASLDTAKLASIPSLGEKERKELADTLDAMSRVDHDRARAALERIKGLAGNPDLLETYRLSFVRAAEEFQRTKSWSSAWENGVKKMLFESGYSDGEVMKVVDKESNLRFFQRTARCLGI